MAYLIDWGWLRLVPPYIYINFDPVLVHLGPLALRWVEDDPEKDRWLALYHARGFRINPISMHGRSSWALDLRPSMEDLRANFRKAWRQLARI